MSTLYVTEPGARIEKEHQHLLVTFQDEVLARTPLGRVSHVVLVGNVGATTPALLALLDASVGLSFVSRGGALRGRLTPPAGLNMPLRRAQLQREADADFCLCLARAMVAGKFANTRIMIQRIVWRKPELAGDWLARVDSAASKLSAVESPAALRGLEGAAARAYFGLLRQAFSGDLAATFVKRARRPPPDPINALLSLGYTLLTEAMMTALEVVGLDPYIGFFHADVYGRPALALDLVEEFRAPIVDSLVLTLVNKRMLQAADFEQGPAHAEGDDDSEAGVYLNRQGRRVFFREFSDRLETEVWHPVAGRRLSYRKIFEVQARCLAKVILQQESEYRAFRWK